MSETRAAKIEREEAKAKLREWIKPGDTVYTILRHVSRSRMLREIGIVLLTPPDDMGAQVKVPPARHPGMVDLHPNYLVAEALGERIGKRDGVIVGGCGMDMGFHLVYNLGRVLWPDGFGCIGKECRSNDHSNGDRDDYAPHGLTDENGRPENREAGPGEVADGCRAHWHDDGGYALTQKWL